MTTGAIVVGAGGGRRLGGVEKAFLPVGGAPLICHSVETFERSPDVDQVCLVVAESSVQRARALVRERGWRKVVAVVPGGAERQDSVRAGVDALAKCEWVLIHDAARPLLTGDIIARGLDAARRHGAAIAATPVRDTLKRQATATDRGGDMPVIAETVDRTGMWGAQTPQVFRTSLLREAFATLGAEAARFTDDAALVQAAGFPVHLFEGSAENVKLTLADDVPLVEALLAWRVRCAAGSASHGSAARSDGAVASGAGSGARP